MSVREATSHRSHLSGLLLVSEVADAAQVSVWTIRREIRDGHLRATRIRRLLRVTYQDYDAWVASRAERRVVR
jgi:excisionase family DNA binding protein